MYKGTISAGIMSKILITIQLSAIDLFLVLKFDRVKSPLSMIHPKSRNKIIQG